MAKAIAFGFHGLKRKAHLPAIVAFAGLICVSPLSIWAQDVVRAQDLAVSTTADAAKLSSSPRPHLTVVEQGDLHMARRRYQAALEAYRQAELNNPEIWNKIGIASQQLFLLPEAKKSYEMSLKMNPKNADVLNNLGTVYYSMQQYSNAEKLYRKALKVRPKSALIYKNLGTDLLAANKFKKGWDCYQAALAIDPDVFERSNILRIGEPTPAQKRGAMSYYLAKSYVLAGMPDLAVNYLRMAIDEGFADRKKLMADKELASLHGVVSFEQLLSEQHMQPSSPGSSPSGSGTTGSGTTISR